MARFLIYGAGLLTVTAVLALTACSDYYRYPCQDPANEGKPECNPPACEAAGDCTKYLVEPTHETKS